jgi:hypothetical protein
MSSGVLLPGSPVDTGRHFRGSYSLHHQGHRAETSETAIGIYHTARLNIPEDSLLQVIVSYICRTHITHFT